MLRAGGHQECPFFASCSFSTRCRPATARSRAASFAVNGDFLAVGFEGAAGGSVAAGAPGTGGATGGSEPGAGGAAPGTAAGGGGGSGGSGSIVRSLW